MLIRQPTEKYAQVIWRTLNISVSSDFFKSKLRKRNVTGGRKYTTKEVEANMAFSLIWLEGVKEDHYERENWEGDC